VHTAGCRRQGGANGGGVTSDDPNTTRRHKVERARRSRCAGASSSCVRERRRWGGALWLASVAVGDFFHVRSTKVQNGTWCAEGVWRGCGHGGIHPLHDQQEHLLMCEILHLTLPTPLQRTPPPTVVGWVNSGHENQRLSFVCVASQRSRKGSTRKACHGGAAPLSTRREEALARTINAVGWHGTARRWWAGEGRRGLLTMMKRWWSCGCGQHPEEIQFHAFRL
jgi:hypothetical protein